MSNQIIPTKRGQICKIIRPIGNESCTDVYIVTQHCEESSGDETVYVVGLKDLQQNVSNLARVLHKLVPIVELTVVAEDVISYLNPEITHKYVSSAVDDFQIWI